jgi:ribonuclease BN (tRNA processing enzyme)
VNRRVEYEPFLLFRIAIATIEALNSITPIHIHLTNISLARYTALRLVFLGSGGSAVSAKRACPSLLLDESTVFDLGPGSLHNLRISAINPSQIRRVFISHLHADHVSDLIPFLWAVQIDGRVEELEIYGPPGFTGTYDKLLECTNTPPNFFKFPLSVKELDFGDRIGEVSTCPTTHSIPTMAFRVESRTGAAFCYSADTIYCSQVVKLAVDVDLLVHEATFLEDQNDLAELTRHSTARVAGQVAREATAKRLVLFHIPPPNDRREPEFQSQATQVFGSEVTVATDMQRFEF